MARSTRCMCPMTAKTRCSSRSGRRRGGWWPDGSLGVEDLQHKLFMAFLFFLSCENSRWFESLSFKLLVLKLCDDFD